jgi:hypothetical protein
MESSLQASENAYLNGFNAGSKGEPRDAPMASGYGASWLQGYDQAVAQKEKPE